MTNLDIMTEAFVILQEECAEVNQAVCKAFRFGLDSRYNGGPTKKEELESEIGDLLCIIDILIQKAVLSDSNINAAKKKKREKLKKWSNLEL
jgi:NTP pyrophosphatase (non-canonical NTP hydrolase)